MPSPPSPSAAEQAVQLRAWGRDCGFADVGVARLTLDADAAHLADWLRAGRHGQMLWMETALAKRCAPARLRPGTLSVISARMDCQPPAADAAAVLADRTRGYIARYALGRDYHKTLRQRLLRLGRRMQSEWGAFGFRVLTDSAPVLEKALARNAQLGWIGKNTLLLNRDAGSSFLLGEIYCDLDLAAGPGETANRCGSCTACLDACPTAAIVAPYQLDARRCISYLTIEHHGPIPEEFRAAIGNRIFGCDDCQLACPWNRYARRTDAPDFAVRHGLDGAALTELFAWDEAQWLQKTEGMALRRVGYERWLRNLAVALGNAPRSSRVQAALRARADDPSPLVREHVAWALARQAAAAV